MVYGMVDAYYVAIYGRFHCNNWLSDGERVSYLNGTYLYVVAIPTMNFVHLCRYSSHVEAACLPKL